MQTAIPYFPEAPPTLSVCSCHPHRTSPGDIGSPRESHDLRDYSRDSLLSSAAEVALSYITVAQDQFEGFVRQACRQVGGGIICPARPFPPLLFFKTKVYPSQINLSI